MTVQRWLRLLPGRPSLLIFVGVAAVVIFAFGFVDLTVTRQALLRRNDRATAKVEWLQEQNAQLQSSLDREQQGQHLPDRAWQYFGKVPRGANVIIVEPDPAPQAAPNDVQATEPRPFWADLWERLTQP